MSEKAPRDATSDAIRDLIGRVTWLESAVETILATVQVRPADRRTLPEEAPPVVTPL